MKKRYFLLFTLCLLISKSTYSQIQNPVHWSFMVKKINNSEATVLIRAKIDSGWHTYSVNQPTGGPVKTTLVFVPSADYELDGTLTEPTPVTSYEKSFKMNVSYFEKEVIFQQRIKLNNAPTTIRVKLNFMVCNDHQCLAPQDVFFNIPVK